MAVFSCYLFEMVWREVSSIAVEQYYSTFVSSKGCSPSRRERCYQLLCTRRVKEVSPASDSAADTHSNVNTALVKGLSAAPSVNLKAGHPFISICYLSVTFLTSVSVVSDWSQLATQKSQTGWLYLHNASAVSIPVGWKGKSWCCLKYISTCCWLQTSQG